MLLSNKAKEEFNITPIVSANVENLVNRCMRAYQGTPEWIDSDNHIKTINFAKALCSETARLTTLAAGIQIGGSARADWLQQQIDKNYFRMREWVETACACGTII